MESRADGINTKQSRGLLLQEREATGHLVGVGGRGGGGASEG